MTATAFKRAVVDTNVFISAILFPGSAPPHALRKILETSNLLMSEPLLKEVTEVLGRFKFDAIMTLIERQAVLDNLAKRFRRIEVAHEIHDCRDPKDNMLLELALSGSADLILTGDRDLLTLHPWRGVAILSPASYLLGEER